jgi:hypothetical protein
MKKAIFLLSAAIILVLIPFDLYSQKTLNGASSITASDLESHVSFLASPLLKGRLNGSEELNIAARYIASQAERIGLKPVNGNSYYLPYTVIEKSIDTEKTLVEISGEGMDPVRIKEPLFQLFPMGASDFELEGDVVFAGYGIKNDKYNYDDFDTLNLAGKIILIMNRAPLSPDGTKCLFDDQRWLSTTGLQMKLTGLMMRRPKAVLFVTDPKSGFASFEEAMPGLAGYLKISMSLKDGKSQTFNMPGLPKVIFVHRKIADVLLEGTGKSLAELQNEIDTDLKSHSFHIEGKTLRIKEVSLSEEKVLPDVAGIVEGSDPVLKNEVVIFSGHMDHIGGEGENIHPGADDDASGCSALLEMAEAFNGLKKKPRRSILFLWVSGEEVGLFGSESYVNNPVFPLDKTLADLNMDMIGRVKGIADTTDQHPMTGPDEVFVITGNQSKELVSIADEAGKRNKLIMNYSLSGRNHPLSLFSRSDHFNFVQKDIPVLFFTTGLHTDYHTPGDVVEKIDFNKMEHITKTMYEIGYMATNSKTRLVVDNPYSKWNKGN